MTANDSLLGISGTITAEQANRLILNLSEAWEAVFEKPIGDLDDDLDAARRWFDPVAQGQRLRREISNLDLMPDHLTDPQSPLTSELGTRQMACHTRGALRARSVGELAEGSSGSLRDSGTGRSLRAAPRESLPGLVSSPPELGSGTA